MIISELTFCEKHPIATIDYSDEFKLLQNDIIGAILQQGDCQKRKSNVQADMTSWHIHKTNSSFQWICDRALKSAQSITPNIKLNMYVRDCWGAVYKKGDYTNEHDHFPSLWSFVFYVDCCEKCSPLVFPTANNYKLIPKVGSLTIFPSFVFHLVPIQQCQHNRIVVSGNIEFK
tara:strand:- start:985 stop:1506 length:522 start_codon:yes stop_codon:yes gene_type:complete